MNDELMAALKRVQEKISEATQKEFVAVALDVRDASALFEAFQRQQYDLEQLAIMYSQLLNATTPLSFWSTNLVASIRPASKGRAYVSAAAAQQLKEVVDTYNKQDQANRDKEKAPMPEAKIKETAKAFAEGATK